MGAGMKNREFWSARARGGSGKTGIEIFALVRFCVFWSYLGAHEKKRAQIGRSEKFEELHFLESEFSSKILVRRKPIGLGVWAPV